MIYKYTVVGDEGTQQNGRIEATSDEEAKQKLNSMGLSVLSVELFEGGKEEKAAGMKSFLFSGNDSDNQEVEGNIEAKNELSAYKRLIEEFGLDLHWLVDESLSKAIQDSKKNNSIKQLEDLAYEMGVDVQKKVVEKKYDKKEMVYGKKFKEDQIELQKDIDEVLNISEKLIEEIKKEDPVRATTIEEDIHTLQKLRMSNNLENVEESLDAVINEIIKFYDLHHELEKKHKKALLHIESFLSTGVSSKLEKKLYDSMEITSKLYDRFLEYLKLKKRDESEIPNEERILIKLRNKKRKLVKLMLFHLWGGIAKRGDMGGKHRVALKKLFERYKKNIYLVKKMKISVREAKDFDRKDFSFIPDEVKNFSFWLLTVYIIFFSLAEISIIKSKIIPVDFSWKIVQSGMVISIVFLLFLILLFSTAIKEHFSKRLPLMFISYLGLLSLSFLFFINF